MKHERDWSAIDWDHERFNALDRRYYPKPGENTYYRARDSEIFHADENCYQLQDAEVVVEEPASVCWGTPIRGSCQNCTIPYETLHRLKEEDRIPEVEFERLAEPNIDDG